MTATTTPDAAPAAPAAPVTPATPGHSARHLVAIVLGIGTVIALMLLAFATPAVNSGAHDLPLAVSGPAPAVAQVTGMLQAKAPGTFTTTTYASADEAASAIENREAIGGIALGPKGVTIQTAAGAGAPYTAVLKGIGAQIAASGQPVAYTELAPLTADDPAGTGVTALGLPLIFGGMATAVALVLGYRGASGAGARIGTALAVAAVAGVVSAGVLQGVLGSITGDAFWPVAGAVAAGVAAISLTVLGLGMLLGYPGIGLGALLMLFVSNPIAGLATGPAWLPQPWGAIGQYLPVGAAGTAIRSGAYFGGHGSATAYAVLGGWMLLGLALAALGARRSPAATRR